MSNIKSKIKHHFHYLWYREPDEDILFINKRAVQMRAGIMLLVPIYMIAFFFTTVFTSGWEVWGGQSPVESFDMTEDWNVLYEVLAYQKTYDYTFQTYLLLYMMFEMISGMFKRTSYLSPTIHIATILTRFSPAQYEPMKPKRVAWTLGAFMIGSCLAFFNPDTIANAVNFVMNDTVLPTDSNYLPYYIPMFVYVCLILMWLEATFGFCLGCKIHKLLTFIGVFKKECYECENVDFLGMQRRDEVENERKKYND